MHHPVYLVSSMGGVNNSGGKYAPSLDVKIEEEDVIDDNNSFSDEPTSQDVNDDQMVIICNAIYHVFLKGS